MDNIFFYIILIRYGENKQRYNTFYIKCFLGDKINWQLLKIFQLTKKLCTVEIWFWTACHTAFLPCPVLGDCFRIDTTYCITHLISWSTWVFLGKSPFKMQIIPDPDLFASADMILGWGAVAMGHGHRKALFLIVTSRVM